jgi:hypothetical protein
LAGRFFSSDFHRIEQILYRRLYFLYKGSFGTTDRFRQLVVRAKHSFHCVWATTFSLALDHKHFPARAGFSEKSVAHQP